MRVTTNIKRLKYSLEVSLPQSKFSYFESWVPKKSWKYRQQLSNFVMTAQNHKNTKIKILILILFLQLTKRSVRSTLPKALSLTCTTRWSRKSTSSRSVKSIWTRSGDQRFSKKKSYFILNQTQKDVENNAKDYCYLCVSKKKIILILQ